MATKEVTADFFGCDPKLIDDTEHLKEALSKLAAEMGTHAVAAESHKYHPQGASVCVFVEESHLLISTWPEHGIAVFNCLLTHGPDPADFLEKLKEAIGATDIKVNRFVRNWDTAMTESHYIIENGTAVIRLDPALYNLERAYATAYVFLDRAWVLLDGDPKDSIVVRLTPKTTNTQNGSEAQDLAREFCNEIVSITNYFNMLDKNRDTVNMILQRALFSANPDAAREAEEAEIDRIVNEVDKVAPKK